MKKRVLLALLVLVILSFSVHAEKDSDGDGVPDDEDTFPNDQTESVDTDGDGIGNNADNCLYVYNPDQADFDDDGLGNPCDEPSGNDNIENITLRFTGIFPRFVKEVSRGMTFDQARKRAQNRYALLRTLAEEDKKEDLTKNDRRFDFCDFLVNRAKEKGYLDENYLWKHGELKLPQGEAEEKTRVGDVMREHEFFQPIGEWPNLAAWEESDVTVEEFQRLVDDCLGSFLIKRSFLKRSSNLPPRNASEQAPAIPSPTIPPPAPQPVREGPVTPGVPNDSEGAIPFGRGLRDKLVSTPIKARQTRSAGFSADGGVLSLVRADVGVYTRFVSALSDFFGFLANLFADGPPVEVIPAQAVSFDIPMEYVSSRGLVRVDCVHAVMTAGELRVVMTCAPGPNKIEFEVDGNTFSLDRQGQTKTIEGPFAGKDLNWRIVPGDTVFIGLDDDDDEEDKNVREKSVGESVGIRVKNIGDYIT